MKKVNFDSLQNFEVPQEWIDKALTAAPKKPPFLRRRAVIGSMIGLGVVLIAVVMLIVFHPFGSDNKPNGAAASTEVTAATQGVSELPTDMTEGETTAEDADATENTDETKSAETDAEKATDADEQEKKSDPETTAGGEDAVKYRVKQPWYVDTRSESGSAPEMRDTSLELEKSELFTGDITIVIPEDSAFYDAKEIRFSAYVDYDVDGQGIEGYGYLEPREENGEKIIRFNLFDLGAYTPSANGYTFMFNFSDGTAYGRDSVTADLIGDNAVTITL